MIVKDAVWEKRNLGVDSVEMEVEPKDTYEEVEKVLSEVQSQYLALKIPTTRTDLTWLAAKYGYEDEARFEIMRKVGMTAQDIRNSINSQILTVFFLPLAIEAIHTAFAFSIVQKLLAIFNLYNTTLSLMVTLVTIVIFGIFYGIVYKITSNAYYTIVSGNKK